MEKEIAELAQSWKSIAITFSGGKDSTALTFALLNAFERSRCKPAKVWILYANTLVEPPPLLQTAQKSLDLFENLGEQTKIPIIPKILTPKLKERFWVLLIGKGYPPPSFKFRWCSDRLKIRPVKRFLKQVRKQEEGFPLVLSGVRLKEGDRRKTLSRKLIRDRWMKYEGLRGCLVFAPLLHLDTSEVWEYIEYNERKWEIDMQYLKELYSIASDGVNTFRTGCWVCTLIKRDKSLEKLAERQPELMPLVEFRKFLLEVRDDKGLRQMVERNGKSYLGPLNMEMRKLMLNALEKIWQLPLEEKEAIHEIWREL